MRGKYLCRWLLNQSADQKDVPQEAQHFPVLEEQQNENPHVFWPQCDHPFEGMSHPVPQVVLRCKVDVKVLARGVEQEDLSRFASGCGLEGFYSRSQKV